VTHYLLGRSRFIAFSVVYIVLTFKVADVAAQGQEQSSNVASAVGQPANFQVSAWHRSAARRDTISAKVERISASRVLHSDLLSAITY
jgi:hypothetical protein